MGVSSAYPLIQNIDKYDFHYASDEDSGAKVTFKLSVTYVLEEFCR